MGTILLAEDEDNVRILIHRVLEREGHRVLEACDGAQALALLKKEDVHLLILDVMLPGMDGYTLQLHMSEEKRTRDIPVIVLSALDLTKAMFEKFPQVKEFVSKPFDPIELASVVKRVLAGRPEEGSHVG